MILFCYGTRPEYIKIKKLIESCEGVIPYKVLYVTQHKDIVLGDFDYKLVIDDLCDNRLNSIMASVFLNFKEKFLKDVTHILVQGDTATALSLSLIGLHYKKEVIHLEAGLRTYDYNHPYPEEMYRQLISRVSNYNLCPTESNKLNLENEKGDIDFMYNWIQEKSGKKKSNPKQMDGIESDKPFVKTRKK